MKRNYKGTDHLGAAADYEEKKLISSSTELPSTASIIMADAMSLDEKHEESEQIESESMQSSENIQQRNSSGTDQVSKVLGEQRSSGASTDPNLVESAVAAPPGYVPTDADERVIVELPALMVRPLKVVRGTFQVSFMSWGHL